MLAVGYGIESRMHGEADWTLMNHFLLIHHVNSSVVFIEYLLKVAVFRE